MKRPILIALFTAAGALHPLSAWAVPEGGLYIQAIPNGVGNLQTVAPQGVVQVDYVPTMNVFSGTGQMQILQAAARLPIPIWDSWLKMRGLLGYRQQWAFYQGGAEDTYGGMELGLSGELRLGDLPWVGDYLAPFSVYAYGFQDRLITAKAQGVGFPTAGLMLPSVGWGVGYQLPTRGTLYAGSETWSVPAELGTGTAGFSQNLRQFSGWVFGYRW